MFNGKQNVFFLCYFYLTGELFRRHFRMDLRILRDESNPFNAPEVRFVKLFRLSKIAVRFFIHQLEQHLPHIERITAVPNVLKVLVTLHFFGHGSYQLDTGGVYNFGMSQPTVSRCISLVVNVVNEHLLNRWIKFPVQNEDIERTRRRFLERHNFPRTVGCIDCTHIAIIAPPADHPVYPGAPYLNRKGYYSLNVQIICDGDLKILNINARFPGSVHDSAIWSTSNIREHLQDVYLHDGLNYHLIGDSGYPLQPWLMVPIPNAVEGSPEERYNIRLTSARNVIERLNGVIKSRFRCLLKHRTLNYDPIKSAKIIYACAVLHNMVKHFQQADDDIFLNEVEEEEEENRNHVANFEDGQANQNNDWLIRGRDVRAGLINRYFQA